MKRRDFFKRGAGAAAISLTPFASNAKDTERENSEKRLDRWKNLGTKSNAYNDTVPVRSITKQFDVVVLGGGLAGVCAAVAAARNGAKTALVQDRPVLGGNSSSEMRVHVHGVTHLSPDRYPERETGIIEELLLHNRFHNKQESFPVWDHVIYDFVTREPNIELLLNTQAIEAAMDGDRIQSAICWQATTETKLTLEADQFIDCSGDGLLAATAGAEYRTGREGKAEFGEKYAPDEPDGWQMGATLLMSSKDHGKPMPYEAPHYAIKYEAEKSNPKRKFVRFQNGIWWIEIGSDNDIIADAEKNRHKLMGYLHGVWDYIKNSGNFPEADTMALDWVGSLPGRRESRRFIGDYILSEKDLIEHKHFDDAVAYGGWSLDEHCWGGIENLQDPPSYFHYHFKKIYQIPYGSLYSRNITNLSFAGRNISQTHISLSSARVMATCALMGQATGTAAALCIKKGVNPRDIRTKYSRELQEQLQRDDVFIPQHKAFDKSNLVKRSSEINASSTSSGSTSLLTDGVSRDFEGTEHHWASTSLPATLKVRWEKRIKLSKVELKCDTNVKRCIMMLKESPVDERHWNEVPTEMLKTIELEALIDNEWKKIGSIQNNKTRLIKFDFDTMETSEIRIKMKETYGAPIAKLFEIRAYEA